MEDGANSWNLVIKVKYGDSLKRLCARVTGNSIDHDMSTLKSKIVSLFRFTPDADLLLQYTDVDGDLVTLETDEELSDAIINQSLNPLRITVQLNHNSETRSESSSTNPLSRISTELSTLQNQINFTVKEAIKSVPEPVQDALSDLSQDFLSKAVSSTPMFSDIVEHFAKLGLSNQYPSRVSSSGTSCSPCGGASYQNNLNIGTASNSPVAPLDLHLFVPKGNSANSRSESLEQLENAKMPPTSRPETSGTNNTDLVPLGSSTDDGQVKTHKKGANPNDLPTASLPVPEVGRESTFQMNRPPACGLYSNEVSTVMERSNSERSPAVLDLGRNDNSLVDTQAKDNSLVDTQAIGSSLQTIAFDGSACPYVSFRRPYMHLSNSSPAVHLNVTCNGCRVRPIVGLRYKSNVKHNYDLCGSCFSKMGNDKDYVCIDQATLPYQPPRSVGRCYPNPHVFRGPREKSAKAKLESRFVQDVTIMDGTLVAPSTPFMKIWRMQNNGVIPWPRGTQLVWIGGDQLANKSFVELEIAGNNFPVNIEVEIAISCIAPSLPGRYISYWRLATPSGQKFGQRVWVEIQVDALASAYGYQSQVETNVFPQIEQGLPWMVGTPIESNVANLVDFPNLGDLSGGAAKHAVDRTQDNVSSETAWLDDVPFPGDKLPQVVPTTIGVAPANLYPPAVTESPESTFETITLNSSYPAVDPSAVSIAPQTVPVPPASEVVHSPSSAPKSDLLPPVPAAVCVPLSSFTPEMVSTPSLAVSKTASVSLTDQKNNLGKTVLVPPASPETAPMPESASMRLNPTPRTPPLSSYPSIDLAVTSSAAPRSASAPPSGPTCDNQFELLFLKELEGMGFMDVELNKEMLRKNKYDLEKTIGGLCDFAGWDPLLNELRDMGFLDEELNKKLLLKNDGSIKHVVLDLINGKMK